MYTNHFFKLLAKLNHSSLIEILDTPDDLKISRLIKKRTQILKNFPKKELIF